MSEAVTYTRTGFIAVLRLNDPARRNALSRAIVRGMFAGLENAARDDARAIVIAANGPMFCAGANIDDLRDGWMEGREPDTDPIRLFRALTEQPRIVMAAVHGGALGGGFELSLACDLVVAGPDAFFALPEVGVGVIPNTAAARLQAVVGARRALELILTRRRVPAEEAVTLGLANRLAAGTETVLDTTIALANDIVAGAPPGALAAAKRAHHGHTATDWRRVGLSLQEVPREEWQEGLDAFVEKRRPDFERFWSKPTGSS